jgi:hypothetical protein
MFSRLLLCQAGLIAEFLEQYAGPVPSEEPTGGKGSRDKGTTYSPPGLTAIAPSELSSRVLEEERAVLVAFVGQAKGGDGGCTAALDAVRDALVDFNGENVHSTFYSSFHLEFSYFLTVIVDLCIREYNSRV